MIHCLIFDLSLLISLLLFFLSVVMICLYRSYLRGVAMEKGGIIIIIAEVFFEYVLMVLLLQRMIHWTETNLMITTNLSVSIIYIWWAMLIEHKLKRNEKQFKVFNSVEIVHYCNFHLRILFEIGFHLFFICCYLIYNIDKELSLSL